MTKYRLDQIGKVIGGGTPSTRKKQYYANKGIAWITPKDLSGYSKMYISHGARDISQEGLDNSSAKLLPKDTVLVSSRAPIGYVALAANKITTNQGFKSIVPNTDIVLPKYLYYLMLTKKDELENVSSGSTFKEVSGRVMKGFEVDIPSLDKQANIIQKIEPITRKIELNYQINANLDEIKTAYFDKSFNQQMQSNLNGKLKNITKITSGKRPNKKSDTKSSKDKYPIVGASKVMGYTDNYLYNEPILTTGRVGTHGIIQRFREPVWVSDNSFVFKTDHEDYLFEILNHWINYSALNRGSTQPLITQTDLKNIDIYVPTESELKKFERVSRILTNLQFNLIKQNRRLDQIKKTLLNKLLL